MKKTLLLGILLCTSASLVPLQSKADTSEMKTIENEKYNWKMKIPKCWELSESFSQKDLKKRHLISFRTKKCIEKIKVLTVSYNYQPINYKRAKLRHKTEDITIGGRPAIAYLWFAGAPKKKGKEKFQTIDWYVFIPCQKGHRELP